MTEFQATVGLIGLLGILLALARLIQIAEKKRKSEILLFEYVAPLMAQLEQAMLAMTATMPSAVESFHALVDAMQKIGYTVEEATRDEILNEQIGHKKGSIRVNVIGQAEP
jgi:hypothetical protein